MKNLKGKLKKITAMTLLTATILVGGFSSVSAYSSSVNLSYNTHSNGNGSVNGKSNGVFYNLGNKVTYLRVYSKSGRGKINVSLIKGWFEYGTVGVNGSGTFKFREKAVPSGKYHLRAWGGYANSYMRLSGAIIQ